MAADRTLERYAWLSLGAALATIALKTLAWAVTGSVGLLSDALEALINLAAALLTLSMLRLAAPQPLEAPALGIALSLAATAINLGVALKLLSVGRRQSIALEADGHH